MKGVEEDGRSCSMICLNAWSATCVFWHNIIRACDIDPVRVLSSPSMVLVEGRLEFHSISGRHSLRRRSTTASIPSVVSMSRYVRDEENWVRRGGSEFCQNPISQNDVESCSDVCGCCRFSTSLALRSHLCSKRVNL